MLEQIKTTIGNAIKPVLSFTVRFRDVRFTGLILFAVIVLLISWSGVKVIETNYQLQKQISALQQQTDVASLKDDNQKLQNEYYNTSQYLELSARANFGLGAPGEKELIVPQAVAMAHTVDAPSAPTQTSTISKPFYQRNLQAWVNFFLHRSANNTSN
jgi:cell division protein FtsB